MQPEEEDIRQVIEEALKRYEVGRKEHGQLDLSRDERDWIDEAVEELLDAVNYLCFQILKLRRLKRL